MTKTRLLKLLASKAKERLTHSPHDTKTYGKNINIITNEKDEALYAKVCKILSENKDTTNPLAKIIDKDVYNSLDKLAKEKYLFDMVDKYGELKTRFEKEHSLVV